MLETDRTDVIVSVLREYLRDAAHDDELKQEVVEVYYDDDITFEQLNDLVGTRKQRISGVSRHS